MSDQISTLGLAIDSSDVRRAARDLDGFALAGKRSEQSAAGISSAMGVLRGAVGGYLALDVARQVLRQADAYASLTARLALVTSGTANLATVQAQLFDVSQRTRVDAEKTVDLYATLARATKPLGVSQKDLIAVTESINKALIVSGTNAQSASAALMQLGQGFASGTLRGDELNSILDQTPRLAQAIADGLGVPLGALRKLGEAGELTADKVFNALKKSGDSIDREFTRLPVTVGQSATKLSNSLTKLIGTVDQLTGTSSSIASWVTTFSAGIDRVTARVESSGGVWQGYVDSLKEGIALAGLQRNVDEMMRLADRAESARRKLAGGETSIYLKDDVAQFERAKAAAEDYRKQLDQLRGKADAPKGPSVEESQDAALGPYRAADALLARQRQARAEFLKDFASDGEKFRAELKKQKDLQGSLFTPADEQRLRAKFFPKDGANAPDLGVDRIKLQLDSLQSVYQNSEAILEAQRSAGLLSLEDYYSVKAVFIKRDLDAQVKAFEAEKALAEADLKKRRPGSPEAVAATKRIEEASAKISAANGKASASLTVLGIQSGAALRNVARGYDEARQAAEQFYAEQERAQRREIAMLTMSDRDRQRTQGRGQIEDRYDAERRRLINERAQLERQQPNGLDPQQRKSYEDQLALQDEYQRRAIESYERSVDARLEAEGRWQIGATRAVQNYANEAANTMKQAEAAYGNVFRSLEDTLTDFIKTGKISFKSLADTIISEFARIQARKIVSQYSEGIGSVLGSIFGSAFGGGVTGGGGSSMDPRSSGGRAIGGPVSAGQTYQVNERGVPEIARVGGRDYLTMGGQGGQVTPLNGAQMAPSFTFNIGAGVTRSEVAALIPELERRIKASVMADARRPGGRA